MLVAWKPYDETMLCGKAVPIDLTFRVLFLADKGVWQLSGIVRSKVFEGSLEQCLTRANEIVEQAVKVEERRKSRTASADGKSAESQVPTEQRI